MKLFSKIRSSHIIRIVYLFCIFAFCFLPLVLLIFNINKSDFEYVLSNASFYESLLNSIIYTSISAFCSTFLALVVAYFLSRCTIKKKILVVFLLIPMFIPTLSIGLGLRILFGTNGLLDKVLGINIEGIGFLGLILGSIIFSFPPTFLIIYDSLRYENKQPYDAAAIFGISKFSSFVKITLPYLKRPLITAFFACFTLIFSDYGMPLELAGKVKTLPMFLYEQISSLYKYGRGALAGLFLLIPAVVSFIIDLFLKDDNGGETSSSSLGCSKLFNYLAILITVVVAIFLIIPEISFISLSFMKGYPNNISFTFDNISSIFNNTHGIGLLAYIKNSIVMSLLTAVVGVIFSYTLAYFSTRISGHLSKILHFFAISSISIPGIVLGIGYIFLFKNSNGWFYGTIFILVCVNTIHFLGSPYLMARNSFSKLNRDYEIVGKTIGVSKFRIFWNVLVPNSLPTLVDMFSYFFLNSMITISAVAFLCTYSNQPLSLLITTFEKTGNYEMQAVVSLTLLILNLLFKGLFSLISYLLHKKNGKDKNMFMELSKYQFDMLVYLEYNGKGHYTQRVLADDLTLSLGTINKLVKELSDLNFIALTSNNEMYITEAGVKALEPYKVKKAIIIAAGFGSRLAPVTLDTPKPLIKINGVRIIDTLIDSLLKKHIDNITIVIGYKKEKFEELKYKYPFIKFVFNEEFNTKNNIASLIKTVDAIDRCYICEADLFITNDNVISKYEYSTCYLGAKVVETDDWCFKKNNGYLSNYQMGGIDCYQAFGISYWNEKDSLKLRNDLNKVYNSRAGKENFWELVPLKICKKNYSILVKECKKTDIIEIDNFRELVAADESYSNYPGHEQY